MSEPIEDDKNQSQVEGEKKDEVPLETESENITS